MKLNCFKLRLVIEIDYKTTLVVTHNEATAVRAPTANRKTELFVSQDLINAGVTVESTSFLFPAGNFQVALIYDPECNLATARVAHSDETEALLNRRAEEADNPKVDIQALLDIIDSLENEVDPVEEESDT